TGRSTLAMLAENPGLQALAAYRLGRWLLVSRKTWSIWPVGWLIYYLMSRYVRIVFDIRLHLSADIGSGLYIGHFGGILLRNCSVGSSCSIAHLVCITPAAKGDGPVIEDRVWVGAHVHIVGNHRVGAGSTIGAGGVVTRDVPRGVLCMGNPARIVQPGYDNRAILGLK